MDRLRLIEVIIETIKDEVPPGEPLSETGIAELSGRIADAIIRRIGLRSLRTGGSEPEGGTMPPGPWTGSP